MYQDIIEKDLNQRFDNHQPLTINHLIDALAEQQLQVYVAGGAVREWILGRPARDVDLTINGSVEQALTVCHQLFQPEQLTVMHNFGLVIVSGPNASVDISIIRDVDDINGNIEQSVFKPLSSLDRDYLFRDFSINCFYYDCKHKEIINPIAQAFEDLQNRRLRLIMGQKKIDCDQRICIRILQFMARGYQPTSDTAALLEQRLDKDINTYDQFEKWLNIYISVKYDYYEAFRELALSKVRDQRAKDTLLTLFHTMEQQAQGVSK